MAISTKDLVYPRDEMDNYRRRVEEEHYRRREAEMWKLANMSSVGLYPSEGKHAVVMEPYPPEPTHINKKLLLCEE